MPFLSPNLQPRFLEALHTTLASASGDSLPFQATLQCLAALANLASAQSARLNLVAAGAAELAFHLQASRL